MRNWQRSFLILAFVSLTVALRAAEPMPVTCSGFYKLHLQGVCVGDDSAIYWSFTDALVKSDASGKVLKKIAVKNHHGDLCFHGGKVFVAVNFGRFNDPKGLADSWVYVYNANDLTEVARYKTPQVFHGAGGIAVRNGRFFVVGGLPEGVEENYVYEFDADFKFVKKHVIKSGHTRLGIQTATFVDGVFWFGCYGKTVLKTDASFKLLGKYEFDCGYGIAALSRKTFYVARGPNVEGKGRIGKLLVADEDNKRGLAVRNGSGVKSSSIEKQESTNWPQWRGPQANGVADGGEAGYEVDLRRDRMMWNPVAYMRRVFVLSRLTAAKTICKVRKSSERRNSWQALRTRGRQKSPTFLNPRLLSRSDHLHVFGTRTFLPTGFRE